MIKPFYVKTKNFTDEQIAQIADMAVDAGAEAEEAPEMTSSWRYKHEFFDYYAPSRFEDFGVHEYTLGYFNTYFSDSIVAYGDDAPELKSIEEVKAHLSATEEPEPEPEPERHEFAKKHILKGELLKAVSDMKRVVDHLSEHKILTSWGACELYDILSDLEQMAGDIDEHMKD